MKRWALIKNNFIDTVVVQEERPTVFTECGAFWVEIAGLHVGPGYKYIDGEFSPPDPPPVIINRLEYINKLGNSYSTIVTASKTDVEVEIWLEKFRLTDFFDMSNSVVVSDVQFLVTKNLITQNKANTIISNT